MPAVNEVKLRTLSAECAGLLLELRTDTNSVSIKFKIYDTFLKYLKLFLGL